MRNARAPHFADALGAPFGGLKQFETPLCGSIASELVLTFALNRFEGLGCVNVLRSMGMAG